MDTLFLGYLVYLAGALRSDARQAPGGPLRDLRTLGEGGMGSVFQAHDNEAEGIVALKVIRD